MDTEKDTTREGNARIFGKCTVLRCMELAFTGWSDFHDNVGRCVHGKSRLRGATSGTGHDKQARKLALECIRFCCGSYIRFVAQHIAHDNPYERQMLGEKHPIWQHLSSSAINEQ